MTSDKDDKETSQACYTTFSVGDEIKLKDGSSAGFIKEIVNNSITGEYCYVAVEKSGSVNVIFQGSSSNFKNSSGYSDWLLNDIPLAVGIIGRGSNFSYGIG